MLTLHDYWRSGAGYRVRIALALKGVPHDRIPHDLRTGAQSDPDYVALAPQGLVPAIEAEGMTLTQSLAILEWIEETWPEPALLPADASGRAIVRSMAALVACDIHPLNNLRILNALKADLGAEQHQVDAWIARWIADGFTALETLIARHGAGFAFGDTPTIADCCLVPQVYSAERFAVDLSPFHNIVEVAERMRAIYAVASVHPSRQSDAD